MKELEQETKIEQSINQKKKIEHEFIGKIIPHDGHVVWQINKETLEIEKAKFTNTTFQLFGENKKEIIIKDGFSYISALNKKNALRKYKKGDNGSKDVLDEPLTIK